MPNVPLNKPTSAAKLASADAAKTRLLRGVVARKKADLDRVSSRGKEVLSFLRNNAKEDMLKLESNLFSKLDFDVLIDDVLDKISPEVEKEDS